IIFFLTIPRLPPICSCQCLGGEVRNESFREALHHDCRPRFPGQRGRAGRPEPAIARAAKIRSRDRDGEPHGRARSPRLRVGSSEDSSKAGRRNAAHGADIAVVGTVRAVAFFDSDRGIESSVSLEAEEIVRSRIGVSPPSVGSTITVVADGGVRDSGAKRVCSEDNGPGLRIEVGSRYLVLLSTRARPGQIAAPYLWSWFELTSDGGVHPLDKSMDGDPLLQSGGGLEQAIRGLGGV